ncbi:hypothetical protein Sjap_002411 [Stephania japonica]|uniref:Uncharacterized protein n=1 Tax=Stephania japonica TaxID=461633 RepID=A0AAP0PW33_9MAGN
MEDDTDFYLDGNDDQRGVRERINSTRGQNPKPPRKRGLMDAFVTSNLVDSCGKKREASDDKYFDQKGRKEEEEVEETYIIMLRVEVGGRAEVVKVAARWSNDEGSGVYRRQAAVVGGRLWWQ